MKTKIMVGILSLAAVVASAAPFNIWSTFIGVPEQSTPCGVSHNALANYNPLPAAWGWKKDTGTVHTASLPLNPEWVVEYVGNFGHHGCGIGSVTVVGGATEKFRFSVYHPTAYGQWPTNDYPITLTGFVYIP